MGEGDYMDDQLGRVIRGVEGAVGEGDYTNDQLGSDSETVLLTRNSRSSIRSAIVHRLAIALSSGRPFPY